MTILIAFVLLAAVLFVIVTYCLPWLRRRYSLLLSALFSIIFGVALSLGLLYWASGGRLDHPMLIILAIAIGVLYFVAERTYLQGIDGTVLPSRLKIVTVCFNIAAVMSVVCGLVVLVIGLKGLPVPWDGQPGIESPYQNGGIYYSFLGVFRTSAIAIGFLLIFVVAPLIRQVALALKGRKYWAWIVGLILSGLMIFNGFQSPYIPTVLGGLALWGLLDKETLATFLPRPTDNQ